MGAFMPVLWIRIGLPDPAFKTQCGFGSRYREPSRCRSMRIRILVSICRHKKWKFRMEQLQIHLWLLWLNICAFPHILGSPSSFMTLQLLHSKFPYIWGKVDFLFYQCSTVLMHSFGHQKCRIIHVITYRLSHGFLQLNFAYTLQFCTRGMPKPRYTTLYTRQWNPSVNLSWAWV
jgi:hypothetical protein